MNNRAFFWLMSAVLMVGVFVGWRVVVPLFDQGNSLTPSALADTTPFESPRFQIDFTASAPRKQYRMYIASGSAFVPLPDSEATICVKKSVNGPSVSGKFTGPFPNFSIESDTLKFTTPTKAGAHAISFVSGEDTLVLNCLVPEYAPDARKGIALGVKIGAYPNPKGGTERMSKNIECYDAPTYFVRIDSTTESLPLAPSIRVGDLVAITSKENPTRHVNFAPADYTLIFKVDLAWRKFHKSHPSIPSWRLVSWFRTPRHNRLERGGTYSRHIYGDAVDIIVDQNGDLRMDDINGDGKSNFADALEIAKVFEQMEWTGDVAFGGVGAYDYPSEQSMGAAVHTDTRGFWSRWGYSWASGVKREMIWYKEEPR
ncbi:MAG: D-Ala-D-Ala carboxypeptidase family metallohydrolase [Candidatus Brocadiia bacterium]